MDLEWISAVLMGQVSLGCCIWRKGINLECYLGRDEGRCDLFRDPKM